jgi:hypothetical protein
MSDFLLDLIARSRNLTRVVEPMRQSIFAPPVGTNAIPEIVEESLVAQAPPAPQDRRAPPEDHPAGSGPDPVSEQVGETRKFSEAPPTIVLHERIEPAEKRQLPAEPAPQARDKTPVATALTREAEPILSPTDSIRSDPPQTVNRVERIEHTIHENTVEFHSELIETRVIEKQAASLPRPPAPPPQVPPPLPGEPTLLIPAVPAQQPLAVEREIPETASAPVHVSIGRVEIRAVFPPAQTPSRPKPSESAVTSLEDYLSQGNRRRK